MEIRAQLEGEDIGERVKRKLEKDSAAIREAMGEAAQDLADEVIFRGTEDIEDAGNFGEDWTDALEANITETQRTVRVDIGMNPKGPPVTFWKVFEYGATIFAHNSSGLLTWPNKTGFEIDGEVPLFISKPQVTIPKKFHLHEIIKEEAGKVKANFEKLLSGKLNNG